MKACASCDKPINIDMEANTSCSGCDKHFCCALYKTCFWDYHVGNSMDNMHRHLTILDPIQRVRLHSTKSEES